MVIMFHPLDTTLGPMAPFVCQLLAELDQLAVHVDNINVDHLCYRAASLAEYQKLNAELARQGTLLVEGMIGVAPSPPISFTSPCYVVMSACPA